jgi:putative endopeptidase
MKQYRFTVTAIAAATVMLAACGGSDNETDEETDNGTRPVISARSNFDVTQIDKSIPACQDFNAHVNRKWADSIEISDDASSIDQFAELSEQSQAVQRQIAQNGGSDPYSQLVSSYYRVALDEAAPDRAGVTPLIPQFAKIDAIRDTASLAAYLTGSAGDGRAILFKASAAPGFADATRHIAMLAPARLSLPTRDTYLDPAQAETREAFVASAARSFELTGMPQGDAHAAARKVLDFETRLATVSPTEEQSNEPGGVKDMVSIPEANRLTPPLDWNAFFRAQGVSSPESFAMPHQAFYSELGKMMTSVPLDQWKAALRYSLIHAASKYLSRALREEEFNFYDKTLKGMQAEQERPDQILAGFSQEDGILSRAMGAAYAGKAFSPAAVAATQVIVNDMRAAFRARLRASEWLSPQTTARALEKEQAMVFKIGAPKDGPDVSQLKLPGTSYFNNAMAVLAFDHKTEMARIGKAVDRDEWSIGPHIVNGTYSPQDNSVVLTAAILQPPYLDLKADPALNYGGIGTVIAHEITHGFDTAGSKFDAAGNESDWWQNGDKARFEARVARLNRQFDAYEVLPGLRVNSALTEVENIADLGGLSTARDALALRLAREPSADRPVDGYTQQQRYFLAWARNWRNKATEATIRDDVATDVHAPGKFRANGPVSNLPSFAAAFACAPGAPMARLPEDRVTIW